VIDLRIGYGADAHRLVPGRKLILGGVEISFDRGLEGHSDADVLAHAIGDALLGALALGDLGRHFPDTDPQYRDCSSLSLLQRIASMISEKNAQIQNIDCSIIAEAPRLAPHLQEMKGNLARALGVDPGQISVKATTTEGLGFCGQGEGIEARAVALVKIGGEWRPLEH
jgi:2-C-methyl-D-erythritol 2,4-cyclodiphosphate synthase